MHTTEFRKTADGTYLRATYGLHKIGDQEPYFSMTGEEYSKPVPSERNMISCGQMHDQIRATFPELAPLIGWHLCTADEPMHYMPNALFWYEIANGLREANDRERANAPRAFAATIAAGVLPDDVSPADLLAGEWPALLDVLEARLPRLQAAFEQMVRELPPDNKPAPAPASMFGVAMKAAYQGMADDMFVWTVELKRGTEQLNTPFKMGLAHCKRTHSSKQPSEKMTTKLARALKPFGSLTLTDTQGYVRPTEPTLDSVLESLRSDAQAGSHLLFEDFCNELGYDSDSRSAEKIWRACQEIRGRLQKLFGADFEAFETGDLDEQEAS